MDTSDQFPSDRRPMQVEDDLSDRSDSNSNACSENSSNSNSSSIHSEPMPTSFQPYKVSMDELSSKTEEEKGHNQRFGSGGDYRVPVTDGSGDVQPMALDKPKDYAIRGNESELEI